MLVMDPRQESLLKRSTSAWRRFSKRDRPTILAPMPSSVNDARPLNRPHKLQKRSTDTSMHKNIITTHMHRVDLQTRQRLETTLLPETRVLSTHMKSSPFPSSTRVQTIAWNVFLTPEQIFSLVMGFRPTRMEEKWFIYSEGPDLSGKFKVHFHRSWTGLKIAELFVLIDLKGLGAGKIVGIKWDGSEQTNGMDGDEAKYMIWTACAYTLGIDMEEVS